MTDQPTKAPRATHTPAERAAKALAILQRRLDKLTKSKAALELQALELEPQIEAIHKRIDYALASPDLPPYLTGRGLSSAISATGTPEAEEASVPTKAEVVAEEARRDALQQPRAWRNQP